jgi:hypothetical protein
VYSFQSARLHCAAGSLFVPNWRARIERVRFAVPRLFDANLLALGLLYFLGSRLTLPVVPKCV